MMPRLRDGQTDLLTPTSLDGYIADDGNFDWAAPNQEAFAFITDLVRPIGTYLCERKTYETMGDLRDADVIPGRTPAMLDFAWIWQADDKIVYSKSLKTVSTPRTLLGREFDPARGSRPKGTIASRFVGGWSDPRAHAIWTGLVDEYHLLVVPTMHGGGKRILSSNVCVKLDLVDEHRFATGWVYLRYHTRA